MNPYTFEPDVIDRKGKVLDISYLSFTLGCNQPKGKIMENDTQTFGFEVEVTPTGIVNDEGRFVPIDEVKRERDEVFVQTGEDVIVD